MIINIRGTSGSGKTYLVRQVMKLFSTKTRVLIKGRKQPIGYILENKGQKPLAIIGHYETACGGCDTLKTYQDIFDAVKTATEAGYNVLFEGLLISAEFNYTLKMCRENPDNHTLIALKTPIDKCIESVNMRRWEKDPNKPPVKEQNTIAKHRGLTLCANRFAEAGGVNLEWHERESALERIKELLDVQ